MGNFTASGEIFRKELIRQLYLFSEDERYSCLFRLSRVSALTLFAHCIFIYKDNNSDELRLLKREWNARDLSFVFAPGVYRTDKLTFIDTHQKISDEKLLEELWKKDIKTPLRPTGIILDGVDYCLRIQRGRLVSEKYWQLPDQLTGDLKTLVDTIYAEAKL